MLARHRSLRASLDWSHDLLLERERMVLRRLAIFAGGFTLEAGSAVAASAEITQAEVVECIANLVAKSLIAAEAKRLAGCGSRRIDAAREDWAFSPAGDALIGGALADRSVPHACAPEFTPTIDQGGRVLIPAKLRKELDVRPGDPVVLETIGDELHVRPYGKAIREAQAIIRKYIPDPDRSLVDELIAERRREAERE